MRSSLEPAENDEGQFAQSAGIEPPETPLNAHGMNNEFLSYTVEAESGIEISNFYLIEDTYLCSICIINSSYLAKKHFRATAADLF